MITVKEGQAFLAEDGEYDAGSHSVLGEELNDFMQGDKSIEERVAFVFEHMDTCITNRLISRALEQLGLSIPQSNMCFYLSETGLLTPQRIGQILSLSFPDQMMHIMGIVKEARHPSTLLTAENFEKLIDHACVLGTDEIRDQFYQIPNHLLKQLILSRVFDIANAAGAHGDGLLLARENIVNFCKRVITLQGDLALPFVSIDVEIEDNTQFSIVQTPVLELKRRVANPNQHTYSLELPSLVEMLPPEMLYLIYQLLTDQQLLDVRSVNKLSNSIAIDIIFSRHDVHSHGCQSALIRNAALSEFPVSFNLSYAFKLLTCSNLNIIDTFACLLITAVSHNVKLLITDQELKFIISKIINISPRASNYNAIRRGHYFHLLKQIAPVLSVTQVGDGLKFAESLLSNVESEELACFYRLDIYECFFNYLSPESRQNAFTYLKNCVDKIRTSNIALNILSTLLPYLTREERIAVHTAIVNIQYISEIQRSQIRVFHKLLIRYDRESIPGVFHYYSIHGCSDEFADYITSCLNSDEVNEIYDAAILDVENIDTSKSKPAYRKLYFISPYLMPLQMTQYIDKVVMTSSSLSPIWESLQGVNYRPKLTLSQLILLLPKLLSYDQASIKMYIFSYLSLFRSEAAYYLPDKFKFQIFDILFCNEAPIAGMSSALTMDKIGFMLSALKGHRLDILMALLLKEYKSYADEYTLAILRHVLHQMSNENLQEWLALAIKSNQPRIVEVIAPALSCPQISTFHTAFHEKLSSLKCTRILAVCHALDNEQKKVILIEKIALALDACIDDMQKLKRIEPAIFGISKRSMGDLKFIKENKTLIADNQKKKIAESIHLALTSVTRSPFRNSFIQHFYEILDVDQRHALVPLFLNCILITQVDLVVVHFDFDIVKLMYTHSSDPAVKDTIVNQVIAVVIDENSLIRLAALKFLIKTNHEYNQVQIQNLTPCLGKLVASANSAGIEKNAYLLLKTILHQLPKSHEKIALESLISGSPHLNVYQLDLLVNLIMTGKCLTNSQFVTKHHNTMPFTNYICTLYNNPAVEAQVRNAHLSQSIFHHHTITEMSFSNNKDIDDEQKGLGKLQFC